MPAGRPSAVLAMAVTVLLVSGGTLLAGGGDFDDLWNFNRQLGVELVDEHYYMSTDWFQNNTHRYDSYSRTGPKVFAGEYASGDNTLYNAVSEAAYMTGLERNGDVVQLSCYAPLLCNVGNINWTPDLIWLNNTESYGTPDYYAQKMFSNNLGDVFLSSTYTYSPAPVDPNAPIEGAIGLGTWNTQARFDDVLVVSGSTTLFSDDFSSGSSKWTPVSGSWSVNGGSYWQTAWGTPCCSTAANITVTPSYTYTLRALKTGGDEGFLIMFGVKGGNDYYWWNVGGWGNTSHAIEKVAHGAKSQISSFVSGSVATNRWYNIKIQLDGRRIRCYLDGTLIHDVTDQAVLPNEPVAISSSKDTQTGDLLLKSVNPTEFVTAAQINLVGAGYIDPVANLTLLTGDPSAQNSFAEPTKVAPTTSSISVGPSFPYDLPAFSASIIKIKTGGAAAGTGLRGHYYDNADLTNLKMARTDATINFDWGTGSPDPSIGPDTFSVRWTGELQPRYSETYTFYTTSDDGVRLCVGGRKIIDNWTVHTPTVDTGTISLTAGKKYDIRMEYFESTGTAVAKLEWSSASQAREIVPQVCLYPPMDCPNPSVAWYKLDETSGTVAADSSGSGRNGTLYGGCSWAAGKIGNAVNLNGTTGYVGLPSGIVQSCNDFTIATWVRLDTAGTWSRIFDFGTGTTVNMFLSPKSGSGSLRFAITTSGSGGEQQVNGPGLPTGVWKHAAITLSGGVGILYIDGVEAGRNSSMSLKPSSLGNTNQNWIGRSQYGADPYLDGQIDDFRIYNWALGAIEVGTLAASSPDNCIGLLKKGSLGSSVHLIGKPVTGAFPGCFYIQCPEVGHRCCGIKVISSTPQTVGSSVNVRGTLGRDSTDELVIDTTSVQPGPSRPMPEVAGSANRHIGGGTGGTAQGPDGAVGVNMVGVLQTTWGKASSVTADVLMVIDDGSGCPVKVIGPTGTAADGDYVRATGVSSIEKIAEAHLRVLLTRTADDVIVLAH